MTYPLTEGIEFEIVDVEILHGTMLITGKPVYQGTVRDHKAGLFVFDNRHGSWQTFEPDSEGYTHSAHPDVAEALTREFNKIEKKNAAQREALAQMGWE